MPQEPASVPGAGRLTWSARFIVIRVSAPIGAESPLRRCTRSHHDRRDVRSLSPGLSRWELRPGGRTAFHNPGVPLSKVSLEAPWWSVQVSGRQWPLILDAQGQVLDAARLNEFLSSRVTL